MIFFLIFFFLLLGFSFAIIWGTGYDDAVLRRHANNFLGPWSYAYNLGYYHADTSNERTRTREAAKAQKSHDRLLRNKARYDTLVFNKTNPDK